MTGLSFKSDACGNVKTNNYKSALGPPIPKPTRRMLYVRSEKPIQVLHAVSPSFLLWVSAWSTFRTRHFLPVMSFVLFGTKVTSNVDVWVNELLAMEITRGMVFDSLRHHGTQSCNGCVKGKHLAVALDGSVTLSTWAMSRRNAGQEF